ncbi:MAG: hypothetical protein JWO46_914, partial [Nocardioidaceae bacterium]|nr:hypothetical protein [Nocardioidaceae bacterium]
DDGLVLVDGGWAIPESRKVFDASLKEIGYTVSDIRRFLVTHMHRDHYTQAIAIRDEIGSHVALGIGDKPTIDLINDRPEGESGNTSRLVLAGADPLIDAWAHLWEDEPPMGLGAPDEWLDRDLRIDLKGRSLDAVATPGHTQGHYVFADAAAGLLFAGDHVLPTITPSIGFEPVYVQQPLRDFLDSLVKVRAMPDMTLLPAHGPVTASSHQRIDELLAFHDERLADTLAAAQAGASTAYDVAGQLPWTRRARKFADLGPFDAGLASFETLAHLELLALRGELTRTVQDGVVHFT